MSRRQLTEADVEFIVHSEPEDVPFVGNCSAIDDETDRDTEDWIREELDSGNEWSWCHVIVTARWNDFEGRDTLGGCSYRSKEDFCEPGGYFDDMKKEALKELNREIERVGDALEELEEVGHGN